MTLPGALVTALSTEHQVIYGYGVVGAHLTGRPRTLCLSRLDQHFLLRDRLTALLRTESRKAPAASPAYALPFAVTNAATAARLAAQLEEGAAGAAWDLVAASAAATDVRTIAITMLAAAAVWGARWRELLPGSADPALPGQPA
jgi:hypothetical protein